MLRHPCILGDPQRQARGARSEAVPNKGEGNQKWLPHPCLLRGPKEGGNATSPCILSSPRRQAPGGKSKLVPNKAEQNQKWLPHPCLLGGPKEGGNATPPVHSLGDPQDRGTKSEVATAPLPSQGPKRGRKCYATPAFSGIPNIGEGNQKWLPHPCLLMGPKEGGNATSPLHSRGSPTPSAGSKIRSGPQQRGRKSEVASPLPSQGPKRGWKCYATPAFSGIPKIGEQNLKWLPHPCLLRGPKEGGNATSPLHSRGSPTPSAGSKIRSGPQQRGRKSEVAASPLPSWGPKRGRKCYVTPAFSGVPEQGFKKGPHQTSGKKPLRAGDKIRSGQQVAQKF